MPNRNESVRSQVNLQSYTLEYVVSGAFDGTTVAPPISVDPGSENYVAPDPVDGIYRRTLAPGQNLGLIDLSLGSPNDGGIGDRYVRAVTAGNTGSTAVFTNGELGVYDDLYRSLGLGGDPLTLEVVRTLSGFGGFYEPSCILVPQGSYLGISGLPEASAEGPNVIRIQVEVPESPWDAALLEASCCCDSGESTDTPTDCPEIFDIAPSIIDVPIGPFPTITIFGTGFRDGLAIEAEDAFNPGVFANLSEFAIIDSTTATVSVQAPTSPGTYNVRIFDPADPQNCFGEGQLVVQDQLSCPSLDTPVQTVFTAGVLVSGYTLNGVGLDSVLQIEILDSDGVIVVSQFSFDFVSQSSVQIVLGDFTVPVLAASGPGTLRVFAQVGDNPCPPVDIPITIQLA